MSGRFGLFLILAPLFAATVMIGACGGSSSGSPSSDGAAASTAEPNPPRSSEVQLFGAAQADASSPSSEGADVLGGPDRTAGAAAAKALSAAGFDLSGATVLVLPIAGRDESLLVVEYDVDAAPAAASSGPTEDSLAGLEALVKDPTLQAAHVTRIVMLFRGTDEQGGFVLTMSLPMSALVGLASGALSSTDAQSQLFFEMKREAAP